MPAFLPPSLLPASARPAAAQAVQVIERVAERAQPGAARGGPGAAEATPTAGELAEKILPLVLRRIYDEREQLGDLTDPFA